MLLEETVEFLKKVPPFQFLDEKVLADVATNISMEYYSKGTTVLYQDGPPSDHLRVLKKGAVKVYVKSGKDEEIAVDFRGEGESFGFLSLVGGDKSRANVVAVEDTICYLIDKKTVARLMDGSPVFTEYFLKSFFNKFIDKTYKEMQGKSLLYSGGEQLLFTTTVGEMATKDVITAPGGVSIREAAGMMAKNRISSIVLLDENGIPAGIVTDRDLREKVVARGRDVEGPVKGIMSLNLIRVDARDYCFEAVLKMIKYNIHHLLVVESGVLKGVVTNHDLMMLQGKSPISIAREIEAQQTAEGLVPIAKKISGIVGLLLMEGAKASNITRVITELNDRLIRKVLEVTEKRLGPPPLRYCWIAFGSEGRREQTFKTDQDNALIYEDPASEEEAERARRYFSAFSTEVNGAMVKCGIAECPAGYMASNPHWRQPLGAWKQYFSGWIGTPTSEAILFSAILFDFRPVYGDAALAEALRAHLDNEVKKNDMFLLFMARMAVGLKPPLGFFRTFVVERSGEHKDELNLKFTCIAPMVDAVRLFALEKGVDETSTVDRLRALRDKHGIVAELGEEMEHAFEFLTLLRMLHQYGQIEAGVEPDNFVNPDRLSNLERKSLKESCQLISKVQDLIVNKYSPGRIL